MGLMQYDFMSLLCMIASTKPASYQKKKNPPTLCSSQMALQFVIAWGIALTNINLCKKDGIVVRVLHFSHWATSKTRLNIGKDFDQLLWTYTVGQVKLYWQNKN